MVSKCANPQCSTPFRYLYEGRLFRVEKQALEPVVPGEPEREFEIKKQSRRVEFFWLCRRCSATLTLDYEEASGIRVIAVRPLRSAS